MKKKLFGLLTIILFMPFSAFAAPCTEDLDGDGYYSSDDGSCEAPAIGGRGIEKSYCDCVMINDACSSYEKVVAPGKSIAGKKVHPGAIDSPQNGIDENCDGTDGKYVTTDNEKSIADYIDLIVTFLGYIVAGVSTAILIWGGIMYASAAGEEEKTRKARKAMIGALVGVIIGVLASTLIGTVINYVTQ